MSPNAGDAEFLSLAPNDHATLERHAVAIDTNFETVRTTAMERAVGIGKELRAAQVVLAHHGNGMFNKWIKTRLPFKVTCAYRYLAAAKFLEDSTNLVETFDVSAVYLLTSESTPESAGTEALKLAQGGERITRAKAREIIEKHAPRETPQWTKPGAIVSVEKAVRVASIHWPHGELPELAAALHKLADHLLNQD